ncbi:MAG: YjbQ family protein [bacterium]
MNYMDKEINLDLKKLFTSVKDDLLKIIKTEELKNANLVCWVPHEVGSLVQLGWEEGLIEDMEEFLNDIAPPNKYLNHDETGTLFRHNFFEHIRTKIVGNVSLTLIVKDSDLYLGKYQDLYYYSPVFKDVPLQKIFVRILKFD